MQRAIPSLAALSAAIVLSACASEQLCERYVVEDHAAPAATPIPTPAPFERELLEAARDYRTWTRVSDRANWAPTLCAPPPPSGALSSESTDPQTHGRKLYYLFAKEADAYDQLSLLATMDDAQRAALPVEMIGQALVKESWTPVALPREDVPALDPTTSGGRRTPLEYAVDGDQAYRIGEQRELFVMLKLDPATPGTDLGWVYGTLTPDGQRVTASGRIESCMRCHADATFDRLFGPPHARETGRR